MKSPELQPAGQELTPRTSDLPLDGQDWSAAIPGLRPVGQDLPARFPNLQLGGAELPPRNWFPGHCANPGGAFSSQPTRFLEF